VARQRGLQVPINRPTNSHRKAVDDNERSLVSVMETAVRQCRTAVLCFSRFELDFQLND
jgi:hypothetical protein